MVWLTLSLIPRTWTLIFDQSICGYEYGYQIKAIKSRVFRRHKCVDHSDDSWVRNSEYMLCAMRHVHRAHIYLRRPRSLVSLSLSLTLTDAVRVVRKYVYSRPVIIHIYVPRIGRHKSVIRLVCRINVILYTHSIISITSPTYFTNAHVYIIKWS